ncbi:TAXI family TRAP transporter solute-binding subunit [Deinococcus peraridilitoris]|uniref:TRAP transporter solute receptor, TAXI family n=1 Tax=Deinococcus peraridilitoris (strain DSM 19664 / LMG 22246 / CIP 109416 / KR-200) TaxID=937777 RepID=L0A6N2_DEIPD|nr:TAXI family TRAP transporter solute-binding subunit [Deinococcus peraridilitoris]AFZ68675.1 TRAP transporter solute receptor, TAXI family [Deinococcus peraridilitoris DSM 19664]
MRIAHVTAALVLLSATTFAAAQKPRVVIATGGIGGVYYYYGTVLAELFSKHAGVEATAIQTAASIDNILLITERTNPRNNTYYCGLVLPESAHLAYTGEHERFKAKPATSLRTLFATYPNYLHIVTTKGTGNVLQNLEGKRISLGAPGSGTEIEAQLVLQAAKMDPKKFSKVERLGANESAQALADGTIDAFFWSGGLPTGSIAELSHTLARKGKQIDFVAIPKGSSVATAFDKAFPSLASVQTLDKKVYNSARTVSTLAFWNAFACSADMPKEVAEALTKTTFENLPTLTAAVKSASDTTLANAMKLGKSKVPYHEGALNYLRSK